VTGRKWKLADPSKVNPSPVKEKPATEPVRPRNIDATYHIPNYSSDTYKERLQAEGREPRHPCNGGCGKKFHLDGITCEGCKIMLDTGKDLPF